MARLLLGLSLLAMICVGCVDREIPLYERNCLRDSQCSKGQYCNAGVCAVTPSRPVVADAELPDIEPDRLREQLSDVHPERAPSAPDQIQPDWPR